jgi:hypothetical protein
MPYPRGLDTMRLPVYPCQNVSLVVGGLDGGLVLDLFK